MNNDYNNVIRPNNFEEFIGQKTIIDNLRVYIKAAKIKDTSLDHILLAGHAGVGKTSLAYLIAKELNQNIIIINANSIERVKDVIIMLSKLNVIENLSRSGLDISSSFVVAPIKVNGGNSNFLISFNESLFTFKLI